MAAAIRSTSGPARSSSSRACQGPQVHARPHAHPPDRAHGRKHQDLRRGRDRRRRRGSARLRRHRVSMVFQHFGLLAHRTVIDNVAFGLEIQGVSKEQRLARRRGARAGRPPGGGLLVPVSALRRCRSSASDWRAFAVDPELMLYDEPFSALDPLIRRDMQDEVIRLQKETGKTMLFITHDLPEALRPRPDRDHARRRDRAARLAGWFVGSPADEYVENFIRDIPRTHVLTLRWIMRDPQLGEADQGPELPVDDHAERRTAGRLHGPACARRQGRQGGGHRRPRGDPEGCWPRIPAPPAVAAPMAVASGRLRARRVRGAGVALPRPRRPGGRPPRTAAVARLSPGRTSSPGLPR